MSAQPKANQPPGKPPVSVFAKHEDEMFERTSVELVFLDRLVGGTPKDPKLVQGWLRKGMGLSDEQELRERTRQTLLELVGDDDETRKALTEAETMEQIIEASERLAAELQTQGFKRNENGDPYIEGRQVKAGIKESVNVLFAKEKWGRTGKGPKNYTAERVFIDTDKIVVGTAEDVSVDLAVGHITGPNGPQSTIGYFEFVTAPVVSFEVLQLVSNGHSVENALDLETFGKVWAHMQHNGLGAMRSQGFGRFVVTKFETVSTPAKPKAA
jgi:hypothetical protein